MDKEEVNGYETFNGVGIGEDKRLPLLGSVVAEESQVRKDVYQEQIACISSHLKAIDKALVLVHTVG